MSHPKTNLPSRLRRGAALLLLLPGLVWAQLKLDVQLEGVEGAAADNVRAYLGLLQSPPDSEAHLQREYRQAPEEIRRALEALGYYRAEITPTLEQKKDAWVARFRIVPGPAVRVTRLKVALSGPGAQDPAFTALTKRLPLKEGDVLNHGQYEAAKKALPTLALERGYFDARYTQSSAQVDAERRGAVVTFAFETGPRYRFGPVSFEQQGLREPFLERFLPFKSGEPYLAERITTLQTALVNSDYFDEVDVRVEPEQAKELAVPVSVRLTPRKRMKYTLGLGYGTDTGPRASAGWENRRVRQNGERLHTLLELSGIRSAFTAAYEIPLSRPLTDQLVLQGSVVNEKTDTAESRSILLSAKRVESLDKGWVRNLSLNYLRELSTVGEERDDFQLLYPEVSWSRVKADDRMTPKRGERYSLDVKASDPVLGSDARFVQARLDAKFIRAFGGDYRALLRGSVGTTLVKDVQRLPASLRFFAGGDQSVRGYAYNALGPVDDTTGEVVGGRVLAVGSVELERHLFGKWSAAAFYDVGNALDGWGQPLKQGVGVGVRWLSPVGPIRVDLAVAVDEPGRPLRLHVNMGPDL